MAEDGKAKRAEVDRSAPTRTQPRSAMEERTPLLSTSELAAEPAPSVDPLVGSDLLHFRIEARIGEGGMGVVHRARDVRLERRVAVKVVHPRAVSDGDARKRFFREARRAASLNHPAIAAVYEVHDEHEPPFFVMEFVEGESLRARLRGGRLTVEQSIDFALQIARALERAHAAGIVHRDVKPENVMIEASGRLKLLDFGIAKVVTPISESTRTDDAASTAEGRIVGTPEYMAPEQALGSAVDARADVFSLGIVLYEMLTGIRPFHRARPVEAIVAIARDSPSDLRVERPDAPAWLRQLVARCLAKAPSARFQTSSDLAAALERRRSPWSRSARRSMVMALPVAGIAVALTVAPALRRARVAPTSSSSATRVETGATPAAAAAYATGLRAIRDARPEVAGEAFDEAVNDDPTFAPAYLRCAIFTIQTTTHERECFDKAVTLRRSLNEHDQILLRAYEPMFGSHVDPRIAEERLAAAVAAHPDDEEFSFHLGKVRMDAGDTMGARPLFEKVLRADPEFIIALRYEAFGLGEEGQASEAIRLDRQCLDRVPNASGCAWDLEHLLGDEGRCRELEEVARDHIARAPSAEHAHFELAEALFSRGAPDAAIGSAISDEARVWQAIDPSWAKWIDTAQRSGLDELRGDFAKAELRARAVIEGLPNRTASARAGDVASMMQVALETDQRDKVAKLVTDYAAVYEALPVDEYGLTESLVVFALAYQAGVMNRSEFLARRSKWLTDNEHVSARHRADMIWYLADALPCANRDDAERALAELGDRSPPYVFRISRSEEPIGEVYRLAGRTDEAIAWLRHAARACTAIQYPFESTWASFHLGELLESKGDRPGACSEYANVLSRWGRATPPSKTARLAREHAHTLHCDPPPSPPPTSSPPSATPP
jgi:serine/threonine-protein kinase